MRESTPLFHPLPGRKVSRALLLRSLFQAFGSHKLALTLFIAAAAVVATAAGVVVVVASAVAVTVAFALIIK